MNPRPWSGVFILKIPALQLPEERFASLGNTLELNHEVFGGTYDWNTGESTPEIFVSDNSIYQI